MKIKKSLLVPALGRISHIPKSSEIPAVRCICMEAIGGILTLSVMNGEQFASETIPCDGDLPRVLVPASAIIPIVTYGREEQQFYPTNNGRLHCDVGASIDTPLVIDDLVEPKPDNIAMVAVNCADLSKAISSVAFAASTDKSRQNLHGVHVILSANRMLCEAYDGHIGAFNVRASICGESNFTVHSSFVTPFCKALLMDGAQLNVASNWLNVWHENGSYWCKTPEAWMLNTGSIVNAERTTLGNISRDEFMSVFRLIQSTRGPKDELSIRSSLLLSDKSCIVRTFPTDGGADFSQKIDGKFADGQLWINGISFLKCLQAFPEESTITLKLAKAFDGVCLECGDLTVMNTQLSSDVVKAINNAEQKPEVTP